MSQTIPHRAEHYPLSPTKGEVCACLNSAFRLFTPEATNKTHVVYLTFVLADEEPALALQLDLRRRFRLEVGGTITFAEYQRMLMAFDDRADPSTSRLTQEGVRDSMGALPVFKLPQTEVGTVVYLFRTIWDKSMRWEHRETPIAFTRVLDVPLYPINGDWFGTLCRSLAGPQPVTHEYRMTMLREELLEQVASRDMLHASSNLSLKRAP